MTRGLILTCALLGAIAVWADSEVVDDVTWYYQIRQELNSQTHQYDAYASIVSGSREYMGDLIVPSQLGKYPVREIGGSAFEQCSSLTSVTIPNSVQRIEYDAFYYCSSLTRLDIPASVVYLGQGIIHGCSSLTVLTIAEENANYKVVNDCIVTIDGTKLVAVPFGCEEVTIPQGISDIPASMFYHDEILKGVTIPEDVTSIGDYAFYGCSSLANVTIPDSVKSIGNYALSYCSQSMNVKFLGNPPNGVMNSGLLRYKNVSFPRECGEAWMKIINDTNKFQGYNREQPIVTILSSKIREDDSTILDVVYRVTSTAVEKVKVRALAFEDGVRSFAKVVRPETFVNDVDGVATANNIGDDIAVNVTHTLAWKVSADWTNQLAKVTFEVLASAGELLPLEVRTIPASARYGKMDVTWNTIPESQWFDALLWLYADKNEKVSINDGIYYYDGNITAKGMMTYAENMYTAIFSEMGYKVLSGEVLKYVNAETRLGLSPNGMRQYGYRVIGKKLKAVSDKNSRKEAKK